MANIGKLLISAASAVVMLMLPCTARAQLVVSDPASYTYFVEQINKASETLKSAQSTVEGINQVRQQVTGMYNRAQGVVEDIRRTAEEVKSLDTSLARRALNQGLQKNDSGFVDIERLLNGTYGDARSQGIQGMDARYEVQQNALKGVIADSEKLLGSLGDRISKMGALAAQIDSTANIKDAMDLNNRIAIEILRTLVDMLAIAAKADQAQALSNYSGVNDATSQQRKKVLSQAQQSVGSACEILGSCGKLEELKRLGF